MQQRREFVKRKGEKPILSAKRMTEFIAQLEKTLSSQLQKRLDVKQLHPSNRTKRVLSCFFKDVGSILDAQEFQEFAFQVNDYHELIDLFFLVNPDTPLSKIVQEFLDTAQENVPLKIQKLIAQDIQSLETSSYKNKGAVSSLVTKTMNRLGEEDFVKFFSLFCQAKNSLH